MIRNKSKLIQKKLGDEKIPEVWEHDIIIPIQKGKPLNATYMPKNHIKVLARMQTEERSPR